ncbi:hypothetical protein QYE76_025594 [Lolium multiflorum]|uniref:CCHC-type domain-containing protein n=1 Tax=Lolium multiflorum TaxID=4521 RepID=A0AAD8RFI9_LOLMU|nr:hypothetical protein QYE76_025594 [Lolium multiflorum]
MSSSSSSPSSGLSTQSSTSREPTPEWDPQEAHAANIRRAIADGDESTHDSFVEESDDDGFSWDGFSSAEEVKEEEEEEDDTSSDEPLAKRLCPWPDMASPINFNQFLEKEKLKSNGSNFTDWFRHVRIFLNGGNLQYVLDAPLGDPPAETETDEVKNNMNKEFPELFGMLKAAEIEIKKEHQVLMVNKTTSFKKQGKSKGKFKKGGKKAATPPMKPKNGPKPDAECYYCKEKGHWKRNCSKYLADLKSGLVKKKKEENLQSELPPELLWSNEVTSGENAVQSNWTTVGRSHDPSLICTSMLFLLLARAAILKLAGKYQQLK